MYTAIVLPFEFIIASLLLPDDDDGYDCCSRTKELVRWYFNDVELFDRSETNLAQDFHWILYFHLRRLDLNRSVRCRDLDDEEVLEESSSSKCCARERQLLSISRIEKN